jgi:hypothetical protein
VIRKLAGYSILPFVVLGPLAAVEIANEGWIITVATFGLVGASLCLTSLACWLIDP